MAISGEKSAEDEQLMKKRLDVTAWCQADTGSEERPIPLAKISTCGGLHIEVLQHPAEAVRDAYYVPTSSQGTMNPS